MDLLNFVTVIVTDFRADDYWPIQQKKYEKVDKLHCEKEGMYRLTKKNALGCTN